MLRELDKSLLVFHLITYLFPKKRNVTLLPSLVLSLKNYLVLLFKSYCAYVGALFRNSFLVRAQVFHWLIAGSEDFLHLFRPKTAREV